MANIFCTISIDDTENQSGRWKIRGVSYIVWKFNDFWSTNGVKWDRSFYSPAVILHSVSLPGVARGGQQMEPNQTVAKWEEVNGADASWIRWRRIVNADETIEIRWLVSLGSKNHFKYRNGIASGGLQWQYIVIGLISTFYRASSYASVVLAAAILSVCPSVCHTRALWQNQTTHCGYFNTKRKGNHSSFLIPTVVGGGYPSAWNLRSKWPTLFETRRLRQISAYDASAITDMEKSSIMTNRKSTTGFPTSYRWSAYVTPKWRKTWLKKRFWFFLAKCNFNRIESAPKFLCVKTFSAKL